MSGGNSTKNAGIALALACAAGACTAIGAGVVFAPRLVKLASKKILAGGLGLSAGVLTYVAFVDLFPESNESFVNAGYGEGAAYALVSACFFGGVFLMVVRAII